MKLTRTTEQYALRSVLANRKITRATRQQLLADGLIQSVPGKGTVLTSLGRHRLRTRCDARPGYTAGSEQKRILAAITVAGEMTSPAIESFVRGSIGRFHRGRHIETLRNQGWIREVGRIGRAHRRGRPAIVWKATPAGVAAMLGI